ncbi:MAG: fumarate hydratase [Treponema sp.]|jgi:fumarate hydratase class I|nr:fumarate hydratase [Treponema sp.]
MRFNRLIEEAFRSAGFILLEGTDRELRAEKGILGVPPALLRRLAEEGFRRLAFYMRRSHLELLAGVRADPGASANDRLVAGTLLENAAAAARGEFALCQDTGTAAVYGWKDEGVRTGADDGAELSLGIAAAYRNNFLRASQTAPASFFDEAGTGNNLPAQIRLEASGPGNDPAYRFLLIAKGAGSSNKTAYFSMTKALLEEKAFERFLEERIRALGTAACPPYRLAVVVGGSSPEHNLEVLKLATAELLDAAPRIGAAPPGAVPEGGVLFRDPYWESRVMDMSRRTGLGAQFGGTSLALDARVIRLSRHAGSCPVSIGVSCSAHRNLLAFIDARGLHLEKLEENPAAFLQSRGAAPFGPPAGDAAPERVNLDRPMEEIRRNLSRFAPGDRLLLSGKLLTARDAAHLNWRRLLAEGKPLPSYLFKHPVYYAGPSAAPPGRVTGSLGPTTARRMDPYGGELMSRGASLVTLAKGDRSSAWIAACKKYGGCYLGVVGGAAALQAERNITASEIIDYPELGMEAVRLIEVRDLPAFVVTGVSGEDLYRRDAPDSGGGS